MRPTLSRRLARAVDIGQATADERARIMTAAAGARTFGDLPADIRDLLVELERGPRQLPIAE